MERYCDCCQVGKADWQTETKETTDKWWRNDTWVQRLCLDCLTEKWLSVGRSKIVGMRYRLAGRNVIWNERGDI